MINTLFGGSPTELVIQASVTIRLPRPIGRDPAIVKRPETAINMHLLTQSPLLKALGWALFDSLWQMALLWLLRSLLIFVFVRSLRIRHGLAVMLVSLGAFWSGATFVATWCRPQQDHWITGSWLNLLPATQQGRLWQMSRFFTDVVLVDGSSLYLLILGGLLIRYLYYYRQSTQPSPGAASRNCLRSYGSLCRQQAAGWVSVRPSAPGYRPRSTSSPGPPETVILLPVAMINHLISTTGRGRPGT